MHIEATHDIRLVSGQGLLTSLISQSREDAISVIALFKLDSSPCDFKHIWSISLSCFLLDKY